MDSQSLVLVLDKIGIIAFALAGVSIGVKKKLDIFGAFLLGVINSVGGGILRDLILGRVPFAISNFDYLQFAMIASLVGLVLSVLKFTPSNKIIIVADTLGLGAFAAAGAAVSINSNLSFFHTILFSIITAVGGGMVRDILINEIPFILKREIYATAAAIGGAIAFIFTGLGASNAVLLGAVVTIIVRSYAISKNLHLPTFKN